MSELPVGLVSSTQPKPTHQITDPIPKPTQFHMNLGLYGPMTQTRSLKTKMSDSFLNPDPYQPACKPTHLQRFCMSVFFQYTDVSYTNRLNYLYATRFNWHGQTSVWHVRLEYAWTFHCYNLLHWNLVAFQIRNSVLDS